MANHENLQGLWTTAFSMPVPGVAGLSMKPTRVATSFRRSAWVPRALDGGLPSLRSASRSTAQSPIAGHADHPVAASASCALALNERVFRGALVRERRRADRFDQVFAVLLVSAAAADDMPVTMPAGVIEALSAAAGDTALVGWVTRDSAVGAIVPEIASCAVPADQRLDTRLRRELASRLDEEALSRLSIRLHVHTPPSVDPSGQGTPALPVALRTDQPCPAVRNALKRGLDIVGSVILLALLAPVLLVVAALVKLTSSGPVLFKQVRVGQNAQPFTMLKFRTMYVNADHALHQQFVTSFIKSSDKSNARNDPKTVFKITNDPRVTRLGRILRKTSLDEMPQFWNVLRGDMSLVGPRPPLRYELEQYQTWHWRRVLEAKPGVTGLWQVAGRSRTTFDEMVRLDLRYVRSHSLWTDIKILLATPRAVVTGKGAC